MRNILFSFWAVTENHLFQEEKKKGCSLWKKRVITPIEIFQLSKCQKCNDLPKLSFQVLISGWRSRRRVRKTQCKYEHTHFCPADHYVLPWAIPLFPEAPCQGAVWQHPAKLELGTSSTSSTRSQQPIPSPMSSAMTAFAIQQQQNQIIHKFF